MGSHAVGKRGLIATARSLAVDGVTAEVVGALRERGIEPVLLKGPSLVPWLYDDGVARYYMDSDLLVPPDRIELAESVLGELGFAPRPSQVARTRERPHSAPWFRARDGAEVDLHITLFGLGVSPEEAWTRIAGSTETQRIGGSEVYVLDLSARALVVALHAAQHGADKGKPLEDLRRALARVPDQDWIAVAALAAELHASQNLARGLRLVPEGSALADRIGLVHARLAELAAEPGSPAALVVGLERLADTRGIGARVRLVAREAFPSVPFMRWWSPLARRGRLGLFVAYGWRFLWLLRQLGPSLRAWRRVRAAR